MRTGTAGVLGLALALLCLLVPWACSNAQSLDDTASRIQAKIAQVGAGATKLHESGGDVSSIQESMQQVDKLLNSGNIAGAEEILDKLLAKLGTPATGAAQASASPAAPADCNSRKPMTVTGQVTVDQDCTVGGDLTVKGDAILHFNYRGPNGGRLLVRGNVMVQDKATLWVEGRPLGRAVFVVDNEFSQQHSMTSTDDAKIKLDYVEFRTHPPRTAAREAFI